jgi:hypothetical protein
MECVMKPKKAPAFQIGPSEMEKKLGLNFSLYHSWWYTITPEDAELLLTLNYENNRRETDSRWGKYALTMEDGGWIATHQGIALTEDGVLIDGQHRLMAIIEYGNPVEMLITTGLGKEAYETIDRGMSRTFAQAFEMKPKRAEVSACIARIVWSAANATDDRIRDVAAAIDPTLDAVIGSGVFTKPKQKLIGSAPLITSAVISVLSGIPDKYVRDMYHTLKTADLEDLQCVLALPPVAQSLLAQIKSDLVHSGGASSDIIARGLVVFDPKKHNVKKITLHGTPLDKKEDVIQAARREAHVKVRTTMQKVFGIGSGKTE